MIEQLERELGSFIEYSLSQYIERSRPHIDFIREYDDCSVRERIPFVVGLSKLSHFIRDVRIQCQCQGAQEP